MVKIDGVREGLCKRFFSKGTRAFEVVMFESESFEEGFERMKWLGKDATDINKLILDQKVVAADSICNKTFLASLKVDVENSRKFLNDLQSAARDLIANGDLNDKQVLRFKDFIVSKEIRNQHRFVFLTTCFYRAVCLSRIRNWR